MDPRLLRVYLCTFIFAVCHNAHIATFPYVVERFGAHATKQYGYLQSFFSVAQLVGGLISGPFKDKYSAEALLTLSFASIAGYNLLIARATTLSALYLSRVAAATQHVLTASRALIADHSDHEDRAVLLGRNMLAYSIGAMIGPAAAGLLADYSLPAVSYCVAGAALVGLAVAASAQRHASAGHAGGTQQNESSQSRTQTKWRTAMRLLLSDKHVQRLLVTKVMAETARSMVFSLLPVLVARRCHKDAAMTGLMLSYHGLLGGLVQGLLIRPLTARFRDDQILLGALLGLASSYFMWCYCHSTFWFSILMIPLTTGNSLQQTVLTSMLTKRVRPDLTGTIVALDLSIGSAVGIFTPALGCYLLSQGGTRAVCVTSGTLYLALVVLRPWQQRAPPRPTQQPRLAESARPKEL